MNKILSFFGVITQDTSNKSKVVFTLPKEDFLQIEEIVHITCDIENINIYRIPAYVQTIDKLNGKFPMYAITLHLQKYIHNIKSGMLVYVNIEVLKNRRLVF